MEIPSQCSTLHVDKPVALRKRVKTKLDDFEKKGIVEKVTITHRVGYGD